MNTKPLLRLVVASSNPGPKTEKPQSAPEEIRQPSLDTFGLHRVDNLGWRVPFSATAIASITGYSIPLVITAMRYAVHGPRWIDLPKTPEVKIKSPDQVEETLRILGYEGHWLRVPQLPTLAAWLADPTNTARSHPCIILYGNPVVSAAFRNGSFCGHHTLGRVVDESEVPGRRKRVSSVFVITATTDPVVDLPRKRRVTASPAAKTEMPDFAREMSKMLSMLWDSSAKR